MDWEPDSRSVGFFNQKTKVKLNSVPVLEPVPKIRTDLVPIRILLTRRTGPDDSNPPTLVFTIYYIPVLFSLLYTNHFSVVVKKIVIILGSQKRIQRIRVMDKVMTHGVLCNLQSVRGSNLG